VGGELAKQGEVLAVKGTRLPHGRGNGAADAPPPAGGPDDFRIDPYSRAVDVLARLGAEVKRLILSRDARLTRGEVERIARLDEEERLRVIEHLLATGEVLRPWRQGGKTKLVLPTDPKKFVSRLMRQLTRGKVTEIYQRLVAALEEPETVQAGPK
jgi:hypothetical protein